MHGYIYIRSNEYWDIYDVYKLGKTTNILDRENNYITSEIKRGQYVMIIELDLNIMDNIEKNLQQYFNDLGFNIKFNAGIEFYKKEITKYIIPYLIKNKIDHKVLSDFEIKNLIRKTRNTENKIIFPIYKPYKLQEIIIDNAFNYFQNNNKGLLIIPCGVGKTLISLWITIKLNLQTIIIGVPNILLLNQWQKTLLNIFYDTPYMIVANGVNKNDIISFLEKNNKKCIIITTYASSHKVVLATKKIKFIFDMKINDECHHLTSTSIELENLTKTNIEMLKIPSKNQLSLTATIKQLDNNNNNIISNDNENYFGKIIEKKSVLWSIQNNIVCDYIIQTIITNEYNFDQLLNFNIKDDIDKRLFLSAYLSLKSINDKHTHHLLIYSNNMINSQKIIKYIKLLLEYKYFTIDNLYYSNYNSIMNTKKQNMELLQMFIV